MDLQLMATPLEMNTSDTAVSIDDGDKSAVVNLLLAIYKYEKSD